MEFDWRLSVGNMITIATVLVGIIIGWANLSSANDANRKDIALVSDRVNVLETSLKELMGDLNSERVANTRALTELQADVRYTRQAVQSLTK